MHSAAKGLKITGIVKKLTMKHVRRASDTAKLKIKK